VASVSLRTAVRRGVSAELEIANPAADAAAEYEAVLLGEGVSGPPRLLVPPKGRAVYPLRYEPMLPTVTAAEVAAAAAAAGEGGADGRDITGEETWLEGLPHREGMLRLVSATVGEVVYALHLTAVPPPPTVMSPLTAPLGGTAYATIEVANPTPAPAEVRFDVDNPINFAVSAAGGVSGLDGGAPRVRLPPGTRATVRVGYTPTCLGLTQAGCVRAVSAALGDSEFHFTGTGTRPEPAAEATVSTTVSTTVAAALAFRNPTELPLTVQPAVVLGGLAGKGRIELVDGGPVTLPPFAPCRIPLLFTPFAMCDAAAAVVVTATGEGQELSGVAWTFPLRCVGEAAVPTTPIVLQSTARELRVCSLSFPLSGAGPEVAGGAHPLAGVYFGVSWQVPSGDASITALLAASLSLLPKRTQLARAGDTVDLDVLVQCPKPGAVDFELVVAALPGGGRWRFPVRLNCHLPPVLDGTVTLEAPVNGVATVAVPLHNVAPSPTPFAAYFTPDTTPEFSLAPARGVLPGAPPEGEEAAVGGGVAVTYAPREYGKRCAGVLVVDAPLYQWRFAVVGRQPTYRPPGGR
jgi:hypothetical protein